MSNHDEAPNDEQRSCISCLLGAVHLRSEQDVDIAHAMHPRADVGDSKRDQDWRGVERRV